MRALVVVPSYNEALNIIELVDELLVVDEELRVCVVDDNSPDGTSDLVAAAIRDDPAWGDRVHLIIRDTKDGRGGAVRDGFTWGMTVEPPFEAYAEMDCDFSHEPRATSQGFELVRAGNDVVVGARYPDGEIIGWPMRRKVFSSLANRAARWLIDRSVDDYTNGFRFYSPRAVELLVEHPQRHKGYIYLSESMSHLLRAGMTVASFPTRFVDRQRGVSNTGPREIAAALTGIVEIGVDHRRAGR